MLLLRASESPTREVSLLRLSWNGGPVGVSIAEVLPVLLEGISCPYRGGPLPTGL